jgi:hypothetical protein
LVRIVSLIVSGTIWYRLPPWRSSLNKLLKLALLALLSIGIAATAFYCLRAQEPVYRGKSASDWFRKIETSSRDGVEPEDEAVQALVAMGTNAVPFLMEQLAFEHSLVREVLAHQIPNLFGLNGPMTQSDRFVRAFFCLRLIGPKAQQAVPQLLQLAEDENFQYRYAAMRLLGYIHSRPEQALPVVLRFLESTNRNTRGIAITTLG